MPYFAATRTAWFSYLAVLPLLGIYQLTLVIANAGQPVAIINGADAIIQGALRSLGAPGWTASSLFLAAVVGLVIYHTDSRTRERGVPPRYFFGMLLESSGYALVFGTVVLILSAPFLPGLWQHLSLGGLAQPTLGQQIASGLGAGIYEELLFRVLLMGGLILLLRRLRWQQGAAVWWAAIISALIFSLFHYLGPFESFAWHTFVFRTMGGLALAGLYALRGFGVVVYTHSLYNLFLLTGIS